MAAVIVTTEALAQLDELPLPIKARIRNIFRRLEKWPNVSSAKPLRGKLAGSFRIRTGDYRVIFHYTLASDTVTVWKIGYRGGIYD
jgi:mRNA-degrading endonuclease RelE of RelBE toxin-antitoxin system